jgi:hypothetical protein
MSKESAKSVKRENHLFIGAVGLGSPTYGIAKKTVQDAKRNRVFKKKLGFCCTIS